MSKITIGNYKGLKPDAAAKPTFTENDLDAAVIESTIKLINEWAKNNMPAETGDEVVVTFTATCEGLFVPELSQSNFKYAVGDPSMLEQFRAAAGKKAGDNFEMHILFSPEAPIERIRSKTVTFDVAVQEVIHHRRIQPSDQIAAQIDPNVSGLDELKSNLRQIILENWQKVIVQNQLESILETIMADSHFELEQRDIDTVYERIIEITHRNMMSSGDPRLMQSLLDGQGDAYYHEDCRLLAEKTVKEELILSEIARLEGIAVSDSELTAIRQRLTEQMGQESLDAAFADEAALIKQVLTEKALNLLLELNS